MRPSSAISTYINVSDLPSTVPSGPAIITQVSIRQLVALAQEVGHGEADAPAPGGGEGLAEPADVPDPGREVVRVPVILLRKSRGEQPR